MKWTLFALSFCLLTMEVKGHDWYSGMNNRNAASCCGGDDCGPVLLEEVTETDDEFIFVPNHQRLYFVVGKEYHFNKKNHAQPSQKWDPNDPNDTGYHACVGSGQAPLCFFYPTNT